MFVNLAYEYEYVDLGRNIILYNELTSKVYTIDEENTSMMREIILGTSEETLENKYGKRWIAFSEILKNNYAIITRESMPNFFDTWDYGAKGISAKDKNSMPQIQMLTLQLTDVCNLKCDDCGASYEFPCLVCEKDHGKNSHEMRMEDLYCFINSLMLYGLNQVIIAGGDPFADIGKLKRVVEYINQMAGDKIVVVLRTNGLLLQSDMALIEWIKSRNIQINIIMKNEYKKTQELIIKKLHTNSIDVSVTALNALNLKNKIKEITVKELDKELYYKSINTFLNADTLNRNTIFNYFHPCIAGKIYVSLSGDISACPELLKKGYKVGNISEHTPASVITDLKALWQMPEIDAKACLECKNRKHCHSCPSVRNYIVDKIGCPYKK